MAKELDRGEQPPLRYYKRAGTKKKAPTFVFVGQYMDDPRGPIATKVEKYLYRYPFISIDSRKKDGDCLSLEQWRKDVLSAVDGLCEGAVVLVGFGLGFWTAAATTLDRPERVVGLVGLSAMFDFGFVNAFGTPSTLAALGEGKRVTISTPYESIDVSGDLLCEAEQLQILRQGSLAVDCAVRFCHCFEDELAPFGDVQSFMRVVRSTDKQTITCRQGDHRLMGSAESKQLHETLDSVLKAERVVRATVPPDVRPRATQSQRQHTEDDFNKPE